MSLIVFSDDFLDVQLLFLIIHLWLVLNVRNIVLHFFVKFSIIGLKIFWDIFIVALLYGCSLLRSDCSELLEVLNHLVFSDEVDGYLDELLPANLIMWSHLLVLFFDKLEVKMVIIERQG